MRIRIHNTVFQDKNDEQNRFRQCKCNKMFFAKLKKKKNFELPEIKLSIFKGTGNSRKKQMENM